MAIKQKKPIKTETKRHYINPTETWWGKAIVWIIIFGMVGLIILTFILSVISGQG